MIKSRRTHLSVVVNRVEDKRGSSVSEEYVTGKHEAIAPPCGLRLPLAATTY